MSKKQIEKFRKTVEGGHKLDVALKENKKLKEQLEATTEQLEHARKTRGLEIPAKTKKKAKPKTFMRLVIGDTHGSHTEPLAIKALLEDMDLLDIREIVHLGDGMECGGWLMQSHTMGYVPQMDEVTYEDDIAATNDLFDQLKKRAPHADIHYLEGNHEQRVERWCVDAVEGNKRNAEFLMRSVAPEYVLNLKERGINYYKMDGQYCGLHDRGILQLGKSYFTHGISAAKHAASRHVDRFAGCVFYGHCFSEDTELLTKDGWKKYSDLSIGIEAATINMETGNFEYQNIKDVWEHDHYKELVHFKSKSIDAMVTEDHAMVVMSPNIRDLSDATTGERSLKRVKAKELMKQSKVAIPLAGLSKDRPDYDVSDDMLKLIAWVACEGSIEEGNNHIRIAQSDTPVGGIKKIDELLERLGIDFSKTLRYKAGSCEHGQNRNYDAYRYGLSSSSAAVKKYHELCPEKKLQQWMMNLSDRQFKILLKTLIDADGSINSTTDKSVQFASNVDSDIDILQALCAMHGYRSSHIRRVRKESEYNVITICTKAFTHVAVENIEKVAYDGNVWCCSVDNQTLIVRRNGKVFVAGNTHRADYHITRVVSAGLVGAWNPGCLCKIQPRWKHNTPTEWTQGYILQLVNEKDGTFHAMHVPIDNGVSYLNNLLKNMGK